jgi:hypothetical protein
MTENTQKQLPSYVPELGDSARSRFAWLLADVKLPADKAGSEWIMNARELEVAVEALKTAACLEWLRSVEGDSVEVLCDNPDAENREENNAVICSGCWTDYDPWRFNGKTLLAALELAVARRADLEERKAGRAGRLAL